MVRMLGVIAIVAVLSACTKSEMKQLEESDKMENMAYNYCAITMGYEQDPKTLDQCKQHYIQGLKDGKKLQ